MDKIYAAAEWLANYFDAVIALVFVAMLFGYKRRKVVSVALTGLYSIVVSYIQIVSSDALIQTLTIFVSIFMFEMLFLRGKWTEKVIMPLFFIITLIITNMVTVFGIAVLTNTNIELLITPGSIPRVITLIINKMSLSFLLLALVLFIKRYKVDFKEMIIVMLIIFSTVFISSTLINITKSGHLSMFEEVQLMLITLALVIICVVTCIIIYIINRQNKYKIENEKLLSRQKFEKNNLIRVEQAYEQATILRHDLKHHLGIILGLVKENNTKELEEYIEEVVGKKIDGDVIYFTSNNVLNALLNEKSDLCLRNNIDFKVEINGRIPAEKEIDICLVISNLLENAIEAELREETRRIQLQLNPIKEMYMISVKNYISKSVLSGKGIIKTSKKDKKNHGIGLKSVKKTVEEFKGSLEFAENDYMLEAIVLVNLG